MSYPPLTWPEFLCGVLAVAMLLCLTIKRPPR